MQSLKIAQALLPTPELIIVDEPTNGLDPQGIQQTRELIRRLRDEFKLTVLLSSHLLSEIEQLCNRVGIIHEGRLRYEGGPEGLVTPTKTYRIRVDDLSRAFELLTGEPGVTVGRNGDLFLRIGADAESISAVNALLVSKEIKVYEIKSGSGNFGRSILRLTKAGAVPPNEERKERVTSLNYRRTNE